MNAENPYRSLVDTKETFLRQQPVTNHSNANQDKSRLWIALAVSPVVGPLLCTFIVTVAGFYYQSTSNDVEVSPMGLIFFPVVALILGLPANYVLMGITLTPIMLWLKKRQ
ncbi:hypothetical protein OAF09_01770, partial [bacterium]|nr:hypothetical protein [bacterium]